MDDYQLDWKPQRFSQRCGRNAQCLTRADTIRWTLPMWYATTG